MDQVISLRNIFNSIFFSVLGMGIFALGYYIFDKTTPGHFWKEILEEHNSALAILVGAVVIGISLIIASSIHG